MGLAKTMTELAVTVPGSLGIVLAIATFCFMAWLVRFVLKTNEKREERLAKIIENDLATQRNQIDSLVTANSMQREEHRVLLETAERINKSQNATSNLLSQILGMLSGNHLQKVPVNDLGRDNT